MASNPPSSNPQSPTPSLQPPASNPQPLPMDSSTAIDLVRQATLLALLIGAPVLVASVAVGLVISIFQAVTQIQEQTISFVPKIIIMAITMLLVLPWVIDRMVEYSTNLFLDIPGTF